MIEDELQEEAEELFERLNIVCAKGPGSFKD